MARPEFTRKLIESKLAEYCLKHISETDHNEVRLIFKISGKRVSVIETRPYDKYPSFWVENPIAQFRFKSKTNKWVFYYHEGFSRWHIYDIIEPSADIDDFLREMDRDPAGIFWDRRIF